MATQRINTKMLTLARESRGYSQAEMAQILAISQSNFSRWEQGDMPISEEVFGQIQETLDFPESFFYQTDEILPPSFYRKRDKVNLRLLLPIEANINVYRLNLNKLFSSMDYSKANLPLLSVSKWGAPEDIAKETRKRWKLSKGPIHNLTEIMEANSICLIDFDFKTDRVDGRSLYTKTNHPVIFTNSNLLGDRLRFTLAYELGHLVMHSQAEFLIRENTSHEANQFAAEFLMPEKEVRPDFEKGITIQQLADLKKKWKVSMQALFYRAVNLNFLTDNQQRYLLSQFNQLQIRRREPPSLDVLKEKPKLIRDIITKYKSKQRLSTKGMAQLLSISEKDFLERYN